MHADFRFGLEQLDLAFNASIYQKDVSHKRLSVVYYEDNFYLRVHAYREKVFKLVNHWLGLKISEGPAKRFNRRVLATIESRGHQRLGTLLRKFDRRPFAEPIRLRNLLVHSLAGREWPCWQRSAASLNHSSATTQSTNWKGS